MKIPTHIRLQKIMQERNLKQSDILRMSLPLQKKLDISMSKQNLSQYANGKSTPDNHRIILLAETLQLSEGWLLGYDVERERPKHDTDEMSKVYRQLKSYNKTKVYNYASSLLKGQSKKGPVETIREESPLYSVRAEDWRPAAGTGTMAYDFGEPKEVLTPKRPPSDYDFAFVVKGDSMSPSFQDGEVIYVKRYEVSDQDFAVIVVDDELYIKKVHIEVDHMRLESLNKKYDDIIVTDGNEYSVVGRVVM